MTRKPTATWKDIFMAVPIAGFFICGVIEIIYLAYNGPFILACMIGFCAALVWLMYSVNYFSKKDRK